MKDCDASSSCCSSPKTCRAFYTDGFDSVADSARLVVGPVADALTVQFAQGDYTVAESDDSLTTETAENQVTVTVTLSEDPEQTVVIPLSAAPEGGGVPSDYSGVPASVTFDSGDTEATFTFTAAHDAEDDDGESVKITIGTLPITPLEVTAGTVDETVVSIVDDDAPDALTVFPGVAEDADAGDGVAVFVDVVEGEARDAVESLAALGLFDGTECEPGRFCPGRPLQRWEAAVWLVRLLDGDEAPGAGPGGPGDGDGVWWMPYVERLTELGVVMCSDGTDASCLDGSMTRGEAAGLLVQVFGLGADADAPGFVDVEESGYAAAIKALAEAGITKGCQGGDAPKFCTQSPLTRRHMALFLYRISEFVVAEVSGPDERPKSSTQLQTRTRPSRERSVFGSRSIVVFQWEATIPCPQFTNDQVCL